jgi:Uma2 family endonuclease
MSDPARVQHPTKNWDDLEDVPEGFIGEIVAGEVVLVPRPDPSHGRAQIKLILTLGALFDLGVGGYGGWELRIGPHIQFGNDIRVPDLAGWHRDRFAEPEEGPLVVTPDWICEILSPSTARTDRTAKLSLYAQHGVSHYWIIDPAAQTLEVYRLQGKLWVVAATFGGDARVRAEPFDAVEIDLSVLWTRPAEPPLPDTP